MDASNGALPVGGAEGSEAVQEGLVQFSTRQGRVWLEDVRVENKGVDWEADSCWW